MIAAKVLLVGLAAGLVELPDINIADLVLNEHLNGMQGEKKRQTTKPYHEILVVNKHLNRLQDDDRYIHVIKAEMLALLFVKDFERCSASGGCLDRLQCLSHTDIRHHESWKFW
jgi:hypothetical protein